MNRLWLTIYAAILVMVAAAFLAAGTIGWMARGDEVGGHLERSAAALAVVLPPAGDPRLAPELDALAEALDADLTLRGPGGAPLAAAGPDVPAGPPGWWREGQRGGVRVPLRDGRALGVAWRHAPERHGLFLLALLSVASVFALGAWWIARRITHRLEAVQDALRAWGDGDLGARAPVVGRDEVAAVASTFNRAAARVQSMVDAHRRTLASVSHELRSPLARLRLALELMDRPDDPALAEAVRDVEELDATVGELLQVGRVQAIGVARREAVDLRAIAADEARHTGARVAEGAAEVHGDPVLLRRMVRNLLQNAATHGGGDVQVSLLPRGLAVDDRGPGVRDPERVFEPFYRDAGHAEGRDGGVGLGLWLVREIARQHGGDARWEARDGGGSRFIVELPA